MNKLKYLLVSRGLEFSKHLCCSFKDSKRLEDFNLPVTNFQRIGNLKNLKTSQKAQETAQTFSMARFALLHTSLSQWVPL